MNINQIKTNGFFIKDASTKLQNVAFVSLRAALISFFQTYHNLHYNIRALEDSSIEPEAERDRRHNIAYIESACSAITSFQHFTELIIKDILYRTHPLLAIDASKRHEVLFDLLHKKEIPEKEMQQTKQLEFTEALERLIILIKANKIDPIKFGFLAEKDTVEWLKALNYLRNRIVHRGIFVLRYFALDNLFGKFVFPFITKVTTLTEYNSIRLWKHKPIFLKLDPITAIVSSFENEKYNPYKIAVLKELARAAFENPLILSHREGAKYGFSFDSDTIRRSEVLANHVKHNEHGEDLKYCPVCGLQTLVPFRDSFENYDNETNEIIEYIEFIYMIKCFCCSFELSSEVYQDDIGLSLDEYFKIHV